jgi:hypothetical protein
VEDNTWTWERITDRRVAIITHRGDPWFLIFIKFNSGGLIKEKTTVETHIAITARKQCVHN